MPQMLSYHVANFVSKTLYICDFLQFLVSLKIQKFEPLAVTSATFHLSYRRHEFHLPQILETPGDVRARFITYIGENLSLRPYIPLAHYPPKNGLRPKKCKGAFVSPKKDLN